MQSTANNPVPDPRAGASGTAATGTGAPGTGAGGPSGAGGSGPGGPGVPLEANRGSVPSPLDGIRREAADPMEIEFVWTPLPADHPDYREGTYVQHTSTSGAVWYTVAPNDPEFMSVRITSHGELLEGQQRIPLPPNSDRLLLRNLEYVRNLVHVARAVYTETATTARGVIERAEQVGLRRSREEAGSVRIKPPREWDGTIKSTRVASDLAVWLLEVKDYFQVANVPDDKQASVASSLLGAGARMQYLTRRTHAELTPGFQHTMAFFEDTMRDLFVPVAQKAHMLRSFFLREWQLPHDANWTVQGQLTAYMQAYSHLQAEQVAPGDITRIHLFLAALPTPLYDELALNQFNKVHVDWHPFLEVLTAKETHLTNLYYQWLQGGPPVKRARFGSGPALRAGGSSSSKPDGVVGRPSVGPSSAGPSAQQEPKPKTKGCPICRLPTHELAACPFTDTSINNRRSPFNQALAQKVRSGAGLYLQADGVSLSRRFHNEGGVITKEVVPPPSKAGGKGKEGKGKGK